MRILITGGAGFIGSHLCERLISADVDVVCVDNFLTGAKENIKPFLKSKYFKFLKQDVTRDFSVRGKIHCILHFASPASPKDYLRFPIETMKVGAVGTYKMLRLAKEKNARFLLASTSEVYGDPTEHPQKESYWGNVNPVGPRGVYDEAKRFAEALTMAVHRVHNVPVRIVRIFNTYGPRMRIDDGRAIPQFISQALRGKPITIFGSGRQTRSFTYIEDTISGILRVLMHDYTGPINIGNAAEMTVNQCARLIARLCKSKSKIVHKPLPIDDPKIRQPDISLAIKELKWIPTISVEDGLRRTIEWFKNDK